LELYFRDTFKLKSILAWVLKDLKRAWFDEICLK